MGDAMALPGDAWHSPYAIARYFGIAVIDRHEALQAKLAKLVIA
jgi:hypothetical protein